MVRFLLGFGFGREMSIGTDWKIVLSVAVSAAAAHSGLIASSQTSLVLGTVRVSATRMGVLGAPGHYTEILDVTIVGPKREARMLRDRIISCG